MSPSVLALRALSPATLLPSARAAIEDPGTAGTLSRMFLKYAVECALEPPDSFAFSWTDSAGQTHNEVYHGMIGLVPSWATEPLWINGQRLVSACLASRSNYYGVPVVISMRSIYDPLQWPSSAELDAYPEVEGAFWGNIFAPNPRLRACYTAATVQNSRSWLRECAAGHVNTDGTISPCNGIEIVGSCEDHCRPLNTSRGYYPACFDPTIGKTHEVITTALP